VDYFGFARHSGGTDPKLQRVGARKAAAKVSENPGQFRVVAELIETVGAAQMELVSSNALEKTGCIILGVFAGEP